jgi:hypothetical protein
MNANTTAAVAPELAKGAMGWLAEESRGGSPSSGERQPECQQQ